MQTKCENYTATSIGKSRKGGQGVCVWKSLIFIYHNGQSVGNAKYWYIKK